MSRVSGFRVRLYGFEARRFGAWGDHGLRADGLNVCRSKTKTIIAATGLMAWILGQRDLFDETLRLEMPTTTAKQ